MQHGHSGKALALVVGLLCAMAALPLAAAEDSLPTARPLDTALGQLADVLARLDVELASVDKPAADRLEDRVEEAAAIVEDLLAALEDETAPQQPARLDASLRRLIGLVETIAAKPGTQVKPQGSRPALEEVRSWVDGYIAAATALMNPQEARRFERSARDLARALASHLASLAKRAPAADAPAGRLPAAVTRLEALTQRLTDVLDRLATREDEGVTP